ncbi:DUF5052 domain-containing protein [Paenibacillus tyrfis]|uniref:DUF5052 domain-containing protein n=1 Tax=Paenibacillus tyrfis TaxID=1501230 RepID=UPI00209DAAA4|nr:DUF5052 domain-containing protein [Paenibacillus tyrfis]MCP1306499.1 DUF5052 domain-containing protein [Paenibacillus tyrfis]
MKKILTVILAAVLITLLPACESRDRPVKTWSSEQNGGLERTMKVYSHQGQLLATYEGKFDIQSNTDQNGGTTGSKILFDLNGKRHIIYNAIVIVDEK